MFRTRSAPTSLAVASQRQPFQNLDTVRYSRPTSRVVPKPRAVCAAEQRATLCPFHSELAGSRLEFTCQQSDKCSKRLDNGYPDSTLESYWLGAEKRKLGLSVNAVPKCMQSTALPQRQQSMDHCLHPGALTRRQMMGNGLITSTGRGGPTNGWALHGGNGLIKH